MTTKVPSCVWIIGGTKGLGLELAKAYLALHRIGVVVSGRDVSGLGSKGLSGPFAMRLEIDLDLRADDRIRGFTRQGDVHTLVFAAGTGQLVPTDATTSDDIERILRTNLLAPAKIIGDILKTQEHLRRLVVVTSTAATTPRKDEPIYCASKAGLDMLARSFGLDERIGQTIIIAPGGMKTEFWNGTERDLSTFMDPAEVAKAIDVSRFDALGPRVRIDIPRADPPVAAVSAF